MKPLHEGAQRRGELRAGVGDGRLEMARHLEQLIAVLAADAVALLLERAVRTLHEA
jgi:hypothetical protein